MVKNNDSIVKEVCKFMETVHGVVSTFLLDDEMRTKIEELEEAATGNVLMGMGEGDNQGMKAVFKKEYVIGFLTNEDYVWPEPPNVIMKQGDVIVGFDCTEEEAEKYEKDQNYMVIGTFVLDKKRSVAGKGKPKVIMPPKQCRIAEENCEIEGAILGSPTTPSDEYIQEKLGLEKEPGIGTFFLGFDCKCK